GLEQSFRSTLFGQDHVLEVVMRTLEVGLQQLADKRRPRGRIFFVGPPGTGKTECARRSEEHTSELQSLTNLVCRLLLVKKRFHIVWLHQVAKQQQTPVFDANALARVLWKTKLLTRLDHSAHICSTSPARAAQRVCVLNK